MTIRNIWSLNIDEAIFSDWLSEKFKKHKSNKAVFFPVSSTFKNFDLMCCDIRKRKCVTIQVKGSRSYEQSAKVVVELGEGNGGWFVIHESKFSRDNMVDFFVFAVNNIFYNSKKKRNEIRPNFVIVPWRVIVKKLQKKMTDKKGNYHYYMWVSASENKCLDLREKRNTDNNYSNYLNKWEML